jgi:purine-binding chemotaxis protein CheW
MSEERYMCFQLGHDEFAIPLLQVREVIAPPKFTPIPYTPSYFVGMMNLRGQVLSIIDIRTKLGIKGNTQNGEESVIILDLGHVQLGIVVDSIQRVLSLAPDDLSPAPQGEKQSEYVTHVYRDGNEMTLLVDIVKILNSQDLQILKAPSSKAA